MASASAAAVRARNNLRSDGVACVSNDEPANTCRPSLSFTDRALAVDGSSFDRKPSTEMTLPGLSEFLFQPRRISVVGAASSKSQFLVHAVFIFARDDDARVRVRPSRRMTSPVTVIGLLESYSAANEWWAVAGAAAASASVATASVETRRLEFIRRIIP